MATQLIHNEDVFAINIEGKNINEILAEIKAEGYTMGATSLRKLLKSGNGATACKFTMSITEDQPTTDDASVVVEDATAAIADLAQTPAPAANPVVEEVKPVIEAQPSDAPKIKPMRRGTKNETVFKMLCAGATIKEIMAATNWTEGGVSSVVYWDPNDKGYGLEKEKVDGRGQVIYLTIAGKRITENELVYNK